jgi:hypothetical protein
MKSIENKDEVPQQTLVLCLPHVTGRQVSGTANVAAPEIKHKCSFILNNDFHLTCFLLFDISSMFNISVLISSP